MPNVRTGQRSSANLLVSLAGWTGAVLTQRFCRRPSLAARARIEVQAHAGAIVDVTIVRHAMRPCR